MLSDEGTGTFSPDASRLREERTYRLGNFPAEEGSGFASNHYVFVEGESFPFFHFSIDHVHLETPRFEPSCDSLGKFAIRFPIPGCKIGDHYPHVPFLLYRDLNNRSIFISFTTSTEHFA